MIEPDSPRWRAVSEPRYPHEFFTRDALREILPDRDPVRVWTGFEFEDRDGALHRLDALVVTGLGVFALRTLRLAGTIEGDEQSWRIHRADGRIDVVDHPLP
ncbi:MAG: nuclease-related domain-containing protein, partial [bacterium]